MARKSNASLLIPDPNSGSLQSLPDAPYELTDAEAEEWRAIVSAMQSGYFSRSQYPMLSQLCRHVIASHRIGQLIEKECSKKTLNKEELASLLNMQRGETQAIVRLSRSMRLSHQAVYRADLKKVKPLGGREIEAPWNRGKNDIDDADAGDEEED